MPPPTLNILGGGALKGLVQRLAPKLPSIQIYGKFGPVGTRRDEILKAAKSKNKAEWRESICDVAILSTNLIEELVDKGVIDSSSVTPVGKVATGVAVPRKLESRVSAGVLGSPETFADYLSGEQCRGIYVPNLSQSSAGKHMAWVFQELRVDVNSKILEYPGGIPAMQAMVDDAEELLDSGSDSAPGPSSNLNFLIGCTQQTEILTNAGVKWLGELPREFRLRTEYTAGILKDSESVEAAGALVEMLGSRDDEIVELKKERAIRSNFRV